MHKMQEELSQLRWLKVFSVLIGIFWIVIAGQFKFDASRIPTDKEMRHNDAVCSEMMSFMQTVEDRSDKLGKSYGPRQFFSDIKAIRLKERKLKPDWSLKDMMSPVSRTESFISGLRSRCAGSGEAGLVECSDEYRKYWAEHDNWERENGFVKDPFEGDEFFVGMGLGLCL